MASDATILVIGTFDTKSDELAYLREQIESQGAAAICMDVSVLGDAAIPVEIDKHEVASAAGSSIAEAAAAGDENSAMQIMARGASALSSQLHADGRIDAMVALGGTMGTDLALDCARVLPTGVPKVIVSTVAFSPLIPADRPVGRDQRREGDRGDNHLGHACRQHTGAVQRQIGSHGPAERDHGVDTAVGMKLR